MARKHGRIERLTSAGGVVYRVEDGDISVVLCGRRSPPIWALPKGTPDAGETREETAVREVTEETGLQVNLQAPVDRIQYWFVRSVDRMRCFKTVYFYLMSYQGGSTDNHDPEFDEVRWFPLKDALRTMTYDNERKIVERAGEMVRERVGAA